jgi:DNA adenine methylase
LRPFLKAAGGKTKLVPEIRKLLPDFPGIYHEPFVGGGAVFLLIASLRGGLAHDENRINPWAILNDANPELMNAYAAVKRDASKLEASLKAMKTKHSKEFYYKVRAERPTEQLERAARFLYLNKTCFNGLWRVNSKGEFNVPIGSYKDPKIVEPEVLAHWSRILDGVTLFNGDFESHVDFASEGDFIYADPPYLPRSKTANFEGYTQDGFGLKDHERLAAALTRAGTRGVKFIASQGDGPVVRSLYKAFEIISVSVTHAIAAKKDSRVKVGEVLIRNFA